MKRHLPGFVAGVLVALGAVALLPAHRTEAIPSALSGEESAPASADTVYITTAGAKFHREGCSSLSRSKIAISRADAIAKGKTPCGRCHP